MANWIGAETTPPSSYSDIKMDRKRRMGMIGGKGDYKAEKI